MFSLNSCANSVYISRVVENEKNKINEFNIDESKYPSSLVKNNTIYEQHINDNADLDAFLKMHAYKIYFYDDIYNMLQNFIDKRGIKYDLVKENSNTLGKFLEKLIKKFMKLSDQYPKLVKKVMEVYKYK